MALLASPIALLTACVVVVMVCRAVMHVAFKIILLFAIVGAVALSTGLGSLPAGVSTDSLAKELESGVSGAAAVTKAVPVKSTKPPSPDDPPPLK